MLGTIGENGKDIWNFVVSLPDSNNGHGHKNNNSHNDSDNIKSCQFSFSFHAWQLDMDQESGFGAEKEITNTIELKLDNDSDDKPHNDDADNHIKIKTSFTAESGGEDNSEVQKNENLDTPPNIPEENSVETEENNTGKDIPVLNGEQNDTSVVAESPVINPPAENSISSENEKPNEKNKKEPKDQNQAENTLMPTPEETL